MPNPNEPVSIPDNIELSGESPADDIPTLTEEVAFAEVDSDDQVPAEQAEAAISEVSELPKEPVLLGFMAICPFGGARHTAFPARMITYPIMPGFDQKGPARDLRARLTMPSQEPWSGYSVWLYPDGSAQLVPAVFEDRKADG